MAELRSLAEFCNFQQTLVDMLRDKVICGINEAAIQRCLLAEPQLTLQKAMELALGMESATQNSKESQQSAPKRELEGPLPKVHQVAADKKPEHACFCCGKPGHQAAKCKFKGAKCHHCGKTWHFQAICQSKAKGASGKESRPRSVRRVQEEEEVDSLPLYVLRAAGVAPPIRVSLTANSCPLTMEVDTGAAVSIVSQATFEELWSNQSVPQLLLKSQFPHINGLRDTTLQQKSTLTPMSFRSLQILHVNENHWLTISTCGCDNASVYVYDSTYSSVSQDTETILAKLLHTPQHSFNVRCVTTNKQSGGSDCGLFAVAYCTSIAHGDNPATFVYN